jgi:hypothetical protein
LTITGIIVLTFCHLPPEEGSQAVQMTESFVSGLLLT